MRRPLVTLLLALVLVLNASALFVAPAARAQDATPAATAEASYQRLDLPAMVLLPRDSAQPGYEAGIGSFASAEDLAAFMAPQAGVPAGAVLHDLAEMGFVARYSFSLEHPYPDGVATPTGIDNPSGMRIETILTEFTSAEGAATAFDLIERKLEVPMGEPDVPLAAPLGDESELTPQADNATDTGLPYQRLNLTFRQGNVIADILVTDFANVPIDQAEVEALGATLQERVQAVLAGDAPGLSTRVARPEGPTQFDGYLVRNHEPFRTNYDTDENFARFVASVEGVANVYALRQYLGDAPYLETWLYQFAAPEEAGAWLETQAEASFAEQSYDPFDIAEVTDAPALGAASRVFAYNIAFDPETTASGYVAFIQVGSIIARVGIDSVPEAPLGAVMELAEAQAACLEQGGCVEPVAIPAALVSASPAVTPSAAPNATPGAIVDPGLTGPSTFVAQNNPWQLTWDPATWTLLSVDRADGEVLRFASTRDVTTSVLIGTRDDYGKFAGDAELCQDEFAASAAESSAIRDFVPAANAEGTPATEGDATESVGVYQYVETFDDGTEQTFSATFRCRTLVPGETVLAALATTGVDRTEAVAPDIDVLLDGIIISPEGQG